MALNLLLLVCLYNSLFFFCDCAQSMESVPDLQKSMYSVVDGYPCVRLVNLTGEIGCANPGREKVIAPIVRFSSANNLIRPATVLVSLEDFEELIGRISSNSSFAKNLGGVLVESGGNIENNISGFSPAEKFPEAEFAPYKKMNYEWNPTGSGIMWKAYNFPIFLLSEDSTQLMQQIAVKSEKKRNAFTEEVVEFDLVMQTTKSATHDSESCLKEGTCLPIGGYSVWSALPSIAAASSNQSKPIVLVVTSMDSASFFRDKSLGAESPISGLITLLAAVDSLSRLGGLGELQKQLVFSVFTAEAWGYLGSRRFLHELDFQSAAVTGLDKTQIEMVMEIGNVGKSTSQGNSTIFAHTTEVSSARDKMLNALKLAENSLESINVSVLSASSSNPGIPPSSLMAFLRKEPSTSGVVLEDFNVAFGNKFYHSHLDDISNINLSAIVAAASLVARSLYILATGNETLNSLALSSIHVNTSLVEELIGCLLSCDPGLSCALVNQYISPSTACPNHYAGVILGEPSSEPYLGYVDDISRFIWNFLADRTSILGGNGSTSCSGDCSNKSEVCIKSEIDGKGICVISTTRYVPAYSTRLKFESGGWKVLPPNTSDPLGMVDPVWAESNWDAIGVRVFTVQNTWFDGVVLTGGIAITVVAYIAIAISRAFITKAMKRD